MTPIHCPHPNSFRAVDYAGNPYPMPPHWTTVRRPVKCSIVPVIHSTALGVLHVVSLISPPLPNRPACIWRVPAFQYSNSDYCPSGVPSILV